MLTDDAVRGRLVDAAKSLSKAPPPTREVISAKRRLLRFTLLAVALAAVAVVGALSYAAFFTAAAVRPFNVPLVPDPEVVVPKLRDKPLKSAIELLDAAKLQGEVDGRCDEDDRGCRVKRQDPAANMRVERGTVVRLEVTQSLAHVQRPSRPGLDAGNRGDPRDDPADSNDPGHDPRGRDDRDGPGGKPPRVTVPSVERQTKVSAENELHNHGLGVEFKNVCKPPPNGVCIVKDQIPGARRRVRRGAMVKLKLEPKAEAQVEVPDVLDKPLKAAREAVLTEGLAPQLVPCEASLDACAVANLGVTQEDCAEKWAQCTVVSQDPARRTLVQPGTSVTLTWDLTQVLVPNVVELSLQEARATLSEAQLRDEIDGEHTAGDVATQNPPANEPVAPGHTVVLTLQAKP